MASAVDDSTINIVEVIIIIIPSILETPVKVIFMFLITMVWDRNRSLSFRGSMRDECEDGSRILHVSQAACSVFFCVATPKLSVSWIDRELGWVGSGQCK